MPKPPRPRPAERYRLRYRRLRRAARALVFENGALCDEVARLEAKWLRARDERRFLLARLLRLRAGDAAADGTGDAAAENPRRPRRAKDGARAAPGRARTPRDAHRDEARPAVTVARVAACRGAARPERPPDEPRTPRDDPRPNGARATEEPRPSPRRRPLSRPEEEEEDEDEDDGDEDDDEDEEDDEEEEEDEEEAAVPAFGYAELFLGSPAGSDE